MIRLIIDHVVGIIRRVVRSFMYDRKIKEINEQIKDAKKEAEDANKSSEDLYNDYIDEYRKFRRKDRE